jgi:hydrogenase-4 component E
LVALSAVLIVPAGHGAGLISREGLAFALAVVLLGMLMMVARRNAVAQIVGFMSLENGLVLAVSGAKGMPLVVEISVALSILMIVMVFGVFAFPVRERYDAVDVSALHRLRGERADV